MTSIGKKRESLILSIDHDIANDFRTRNAEIKHTLPPSETVEVHRLNPIVRRIGKSGNKLVEQTLFSSPDSSIDTDYIVSKKRGNMTER